MSLNAVSHFSSRSLEQSPIINPRLEAGDDDNGCIATASKVFSVAAALIFSIGSFILGGPLVGLVVTLIAGTGLMWLFNSCCSESDPHTRHEQAMSPPWYHQFFPAHSAPVHQHQHQHVPVGRQQAPHVSVGGGHFQQPSTPWYQRMFSFIPSNVRQMNNPTSQPHVGVGGGHHSIQPHVGVGRGHMPPGFNPGTSNIPPPSGPASHVAVGRGHYRRS